MKCSPLAFTNNNFPLVIFFCKRKLYFLLCPPFQMPFTSSPPPTCFLWKVMLHKSAKCYIFKWWVLWRFPFYPSFSFINTGCFWQPAITSFGSVAKAVFGSSEIHWFQWQCLKYCFPLGNSFSQTHFALTHLAPGTLHSAHTGCEQKGDRVHSVKFKGLFLDQAVIKLGH